MTFSTKNRRPWTLALVALVVVGIAVLSLVVAHAQTVPPPPDINLPPVDISKIQTPAIVQPSTAPPAAPSTGWSFFSISGVLGGAIAWTVFALNYLVALIAGVAVAILSYFIEIFLFLNTRVTSSVVVQKGFGVTLAIANLGFVLGIIIIAILTILQSQSYGIKQILWKLILMAVLVNFSLSLVGVLLGFSDNLTLYFLNQINPSGGAGYFNFASSIAGAFAPQRVFVMGTTGDELSITTNAGNFAGAAGQSFAGILQPLLNLFFPTIFLILVIITLAALVVMILIRYVFLSVLLVLMPIAWLTWVFPAISSNWSKWWHHFIKWTFFTPILVFFLYLAILASYAMSGGDPISALAGMKYQAPTSAGGSVVQGFESFMGSFFNTMIGTILQMTVMIGLVIGGLFAANSMGIKFADTGMNMAKGFGGYLGRRGKQLATSPFRGTGGQRAATWLQQQGATRGAFLKTLSFPIRRLGRGLQSIGALGGARAVGDARSRLGDMTDGQLAAGMTTFTAPERLFALDRLREKDSLDKLEKFGGIDRYLDKDLFDRYQQGGALKKMNKFILSDSLMRDAAKAIGKDGLTAKVADRENILGGGTRAMVEARELLREASVKFAKTLTKGDISKAQVNDVFSGKAALGMDEKTMEQLGKYVAIGVATSAPELVSSILNKMNGEALGKFRDDTYPNAINSADISDELKGKRRDTFDKIVLMNAVSATGETQAETAAGEVKPPKPAEPAKK